MDNRVFEPTLATDQQLLLVHDRQYLRDVADDQVIEDWESVYMSDGTNSAARYAAGSVLKLVQEVYKKTVRHGFAIVRPPGHHAECGRARGFCFFNNVALAARWLTVKGKRVAIVDWDVHAGNGEQDIFYRDDQVLTISIHRHDRGKFYPGEGDKYGPVSIGEDRGRGHHVNVCWNLADGYAPGDDEYYYAFDKVVMPMLKQFKPDYILVAAGFDAASGDPIGGLEVTPRCYGRLTRLLKSRGVPVILILEGGYDLENLRDCAYECGCALVTPVPKNREEYPLFTPHPRAVRDVGETVQILKGMGVLDWKT